MKKLSEAHPLVQFAVNNNTFIQYVAFFGGIFYAIFLLPLKNPFSISALILGEVLIGLCSVLSSSVFMQADYGKKKQEFQLNEALNAETRTLPESIPNFSFLLLRNSLIVIALVSTLALFWGGGAFTLGPWLSRFFTDAPESSKAAGSMRLLVSLPFIFIALYSSISALSVIPAWLDLYILKHEGILAAYYKPDAIKPFPWWGFVKGFLYIVLSSLAIAGLMLLRAFLNKGIDSLDFSQMPTWLLYLMPFLVFSMLFLGLWYFLRSLRHRPQKLKQEQAVALEKFGLDSAEYLALKERERQMNSSDSQNSLKFLTSMLTGAGGLIAVWLLGMSVLTIFEMPHPLRVLFAMVLLIGGPIAVIIVVYKRHRATPIYIPEEFEQIKKALASADYLSAKAAAESLLDKLPPSEANFAAASAYLSAGDLGRAEELVRATVKIILEQVDSSQKKAQQAKYLGLLGKILILDGRYQEAEEFLYQGQGLEQGEVSIYTFLAELLLVQNLSPNIALDYLNEAFAANERKIFESEQSKMLTARLLKAWALSRMEDKQEALVLLKEAFELSDKTNQSEQAELHYYAAHVALAQGKADTAKAAFNRAIETDPKGIFAKLAQSYL